MCVDEPAVMLAHEEAKLSMTDGTIRDLCVRLPSREHKLWGLLSVVARSMSARDGCVRCPVTRGSRSAPSPPGIGVVLEAIGTRPSVTLPSFPVAAG